MELVDDLSECCLTYSADLSSEECGDELGESDNRICSLSSSMLVGEFELVRDSLCVTSFSRSNEPLCCEVADLSGLLYLRCAKSSL